MSTTSSKAAWLASRGEDAYKAFLSTLTEAESRALPFHWRFWARPEQLAPDGDWVVWLIMAGRGSGKTRAGAEWIREQVERRGKRRLHLVARTAADVRDVLVEGESGILACSDPGWRPMYEPSKRRLTWPNGALATTFSADEPNALRGPQCDSAWADELASWNFIGNSAQDNPWDQLMFGLRLGNDPRCVVTTTPRPKKLVRKLMSLPTTVVTKGSTHDNMANLAPAFVQQIIQRYEGTTTGRQELHGELLDELPGALWWHGMIDSARVKMAPDLRRIVVGIDPSVTGKAESDEAGIVAAGMDSRRPEHFYVLRDTSLRASPNQWAGVAINTLRGLEGDRIVAEVNNGGEMVEETLRNIDPNVPYTSVWASRGKQTRAEPISALYEQGRVHHVGTLGELEDEMTNWIPGEGRSPNRVDALVWCITELLGGTSPIAAPSGDSGPSLWKV